MSRPYQRLALRFALRRLDWLSEEEREMLLDSDVTELVLDLSEQRLWRVASSGEVDETDGSRLFDGSLLRIWLDFIRDGGLDQILKFILEIIKAF